MIHSSVIDVGVTLMQDRLKANCGVFEADDCSFCARGRGDYMLATNLGKKGDAVR